MLLIVQTATGILPGVTLLAVLMIVGWGFGLAAAMACRCVDGVGLADWRRGQFLGLGLALSIASVVLAAYVLVLDAVGVL